MLDTMLNQASITVEKLHPERGELMGVTKYQWVFLVTVVLGLVLAILHYLWWRRNVWNLKTVPTAKCDNHIFIAFAILTSVFRNKMAGSNVLFFQFLRGLVLIHQQLNFGSFYMWTGLRPVVFCFTPDFFEAILKSQTNLQKSFDYSFLSLWLKEGLVTSSGNKWRTRRKTITTTFHYKILEDFVSVFDEQSRILVKKLKAESHKDWVDVVPFVTMCTLDVICETAMGIRIKAQDNNDSVYVKTMHKVCEAFVGRVLRPWLWSNWIYFKTKVGKDFRKNAAAMDKFTRQVIINKKTELLERQQKEKDAPEGEKEKKKALLDLLLDMHLKDSNSLSEQDVQEEVDSFMFAGHDTTAAGISWTLYLLGLHPEIQAKVQDELDEVFGHDREKLVTEEHLKKLRYLDYVIKESQRIFTPAPYIGRELQEDVTVNGVTIPKGTTCMLVIYMLHRNLDTFPDPEKFDPDRFLPENCAGRHPYAYCPFSAGPRSCIGQKFAVLEEKTVITNILRNFNIKSIEQRDKIQLTAEMVLRSKGGIKLRLTPRR